jgi:hypothetical protein
MEGYGKKSDGGYVNNESAESGGGISRRDLVKYSAGTVACIYLCGLPGCGS